MKIQESGENYLETILMLQQRNGSVRSVDVANELAYTKASISRAMGILKKAGYITIDEAGSIILTSSGRETAGKIYERHEVITAYLTDVLGVSQETAANDACRIEHIISDETFNKIKELTIENAPGD